MAPMDGAAAAAPSQAFQLPDTGTLILGVIAAGWAVRFLLWSISQVRLQRLKARAMRTNRPIGHWAEAVGLSRTPLVHVIPRGAPFLAGILKRSVYVPAALINGAGASQVIVHELVHLKRGDLATRPLERAPLRALRHLDLEHVAGRQPADSSSSTSRAARIAASR